MKKEKKTLTWEEVAKRKAAKAAYDKEYKARKKAEKEGPLNPTTPLPYPRTTPKTAQNQTKQARSATKTQEPAQAQAPAPIAPQEPKKESLMTVIPTRSALMAQAQARGIKYFRVMNKVELETVLTHPNLIEETAAAAKARWQAGWGKRGQK